MHLVIMFNIYLVVSLSAAEVPDQNADSKDENKQNNKDSYNNRRCRRRCWNHFFGNVSVHSGPLNSVL